MDITDPVRAAALVADLGFLLRWDMPADGRRALLVIALREAPTLRHYDPELITYWRTDERERGRPADLSLSTPMPVWTDFSWGRIEIWDRLGVTNSFISVGGELRATRVDPHTAVVTLASPGPILAQGGHSQAYDQLSAEMAGFFARVLVPIDFVPGAEARFSHATPAERYAAFLRHDTARLEINELVREAYGPDAGLVRAEAARMSGRYPETWERGGQLLADLGLAPVIARPAGSERPAAVGSA